MSVKNERQLEYNDNFNKTEFTNEKKKNTKTSGSRKELQNDSTHNVANISTTLFPVKGMTGCETWRLVDLNVPLKMINEV